MEIHKPEIVLTNTHIECSYLWCAKKPTRTIRLSYATYRFCNEHFEKYGKKLKEADK